MKRYDFQQYSPEYWSARCGVPTSSCFDSIITATGKPSSAMTTYAYQLIADRLSDDYGVVEDYQSAAMKNGQIVEPKARRFYEFDRGVTVAQVGFCMTDDGRFGCSPDSLVGDDGGLEVKSPLPHTHVKYLMEDGKLLNDYRQQVHGSLLVTGRKWWDLMSYCKGFPPCLVRVVPDDYTEALRKYLDEFWTLYQTCWAKIQKMQPEEAPAKVVTEADAVASMFVP